MDSGVPTDTEGPGSNPFEANFYNFILLLFFNPFLLSFFSVVHIASKKFHVWKGPNMT